MAAMEEQETTVTHIRGEDIVYVWTANIVHLRALRKDERATVTDDGGDWAMFSIPADQFDPLKGFKRKKREMTEEQSIAAAERMRKARAARQPSEAKGARK